tara:strand:+ start:76 stop:471 length:396 start_codon:yes stop_codon:yes gene_type:complete
MGSARTASQAPDPKFKEGVENLKKMPEGRERSMGFAELMLTGAAAGTGIMGRKGKATITKRDDEEETAKKERSVNDFDMDNVRKRLLEKAKEERAKRSELLAQEKQIYDQSLPNSLKEMKKPPLQFMVRGG